MITIISDIHLCAQREDITTRFTNFLHNLNTKELYIIGDLFDFWIGDDYITPYNKYIIDELARLDIRGITTFFIHGNRDFLLGKQFAAAAKIKLLPTYHVINSYGKTRLLLHGDTLCTKDLAYMQFRQQVHDKNWQDDFLSKSVDARLAIVNQVRTASQKYGLDNYGEITDVTPSELVAVVKKYAVDQVIHGHTHRPQQKHLEIDNKQINHLVLGDWDKSSWHICIDNQGEELVCQE